MIPSYDGEQIGKVCVFWKHGFPRKATKLIAERVINIFIVRNLDNWLVSMYHKPYYLFKHKDDNFLNFLKRSQRISSRKGCQMEAYNAENGKPLNWFDDDKTIFDIRTMKLKSYIRFANKHPDIVFVNTEWLQKPENCHKFLCKLDDVFKFGINREKLVTEIDYNCKKPEIKEKISKYPQLIYENERNLINRMKHDEIEDWVKILKYDIKNGNDWLDNNIDNDFYENFVNGNDDIKLSGEISC